MALRALEDDDKGLIDGLVVTEPSIQPEDGRFVIRFGDDPPFDPAGRTIYDSMSLMSVYAACAALAPSLPLAAAPLFPSLNIDPLGGPADPARPVATRSSRKALSPAIRRTSTRSPRSPRSARTATPRRSTGACPRTRR